MDSGPVVIGVTFVFAVVTTTPFKVSFVVTFPIVDIEVDDGVDTVSFTASIILFTTTVAVAVSQFAGVTFTSDELLSHNWYEIV